MRVERASKIIREHYGNDFILQVRKPHGKRYFIVDTIKGTSNMTESEVMKLQYK